MKTMLVIAAMVIASMSIFRADDKPVTFDKLPKPAQEFIKANYPDDAVSFATVDDDIIRPDYQVYLVSGVKVQFEHNGALDKIDTKNGDIPEGIIPVQIVEIVKGHYPDAKILEYEVGRHTYEVKLSNRMELKFNSNFNIIEVDD